MIEPKTIKTPQAKPPDSKVLGEIIRDTRCMVKRRCNNISIAALEKHIAFRPVAKDFAAALGGDGINIIAEIKRAVPRLVNGRIKEVVVDKSAAATEELAEGYEQNGAKCLSVLTKQRWFGGGPGDIGKARNGSTLPILRKDFIVDPWQVFESRALGADAILLIIAALDRPLAEELESIAVNLGMGVLAEVHSAAELETVARLKTRLIGINNRNLKTLEINLKTTEDLARRLPPKSLAVCESGINNGEDIKRLRGCGVNAFLVGGALMRTAKPWRTLGQLITDAEK